MMSASDSIAPCNRTLFYFSRTNSIPFDALWKLFNIYRDALKSKEIV